MKLKLLMIITCLLASTSPGSAQKGEPRNTDVTRFSLGKATQVGTIAVIPIIAKTPIDRDKYITLSEAIKKQLVEIVEIPGREEVNALEVRNRSELPLMLVAGELLLGGKQDRIVAKDTIIPPRESRRVPVFCVEHGRWQGSKMSFAPAETFVPDLVRSSASGSRDQTEVWAKVAEANEIAGTGSSTGTVQALIRDPKVAQLVEETSRKLRNGFENSPNTVGVICWLNGKIHSADLFANGALFSENRDKLLRSYSIDAQLTKNPKVVAIDRKACTQFLEEIIKARRTLTERGQYDATFQLKDGKVKGYESGRGGFGGGLGGGGLGGFGHGSYRPGGR
jgi:hypothetical protein